MTVRERKTEKHKEKMTETERERQPNIMRK